MKFPVNTFNLYSGTVAIAIHCITMCNGITLVASSKSALLCATFVKFVGKKSIRTGYPLAYFTLYALVKNIYYVKFDKAFFLNNV